MSPFMAAIVGFVLDETDLIELFVDQNPFHLAEDELDIVLSWRHQVAGEFYIFRELRKYTVFLSSEKGPVAYGVIALSQPFEELVGPYLPVLTETVLMPFKDRETKGTFYFFTCFRGRPRG
jgi:hypothetical protein